MMYQTSMQLPEPSARAALFAKVGGKYVEASVSQVCERAYAYLAMKAAEDRVALDSPRKAREFLAPIAGLDHEEFHVVFLDNRHRVIASECLFKGTIDGASVHPREVVKRVFELGAAAVIFAHNHPSGVAEPSQADELITARLKNALALIDVRTIDHLIFAGKSVVSLAERGVL